MEKSGKQRMEPGMSMEPSIRNKENIGNPEASVKITRKALRSGSSRDLTYLSVLVTLAKK